MIGEPTRLWDLLAHGVVANERFMNDFATVMDIYLPSHKGATSKLLPMPPRQWLFSQESTGKLAREGSTGLERLAVK